MRVLLFCCCCCFILLNCWSTMIITLSIQIFFNLFCVINVFGKFILGNLLLHNYSFFFYYFSILNFFSNNQCPKNLKVKKQLQFKNENFNICRLWSSKTKFLILWNLQSFLFFNTLHFISLYTTDHNPFYYKHWFSKGFFGFLMCVAAITFWPHIVKNWTW